MHFASLSTDKPIHTIYLQDSTCQINDRIFNLLLKVSHVFKNLHEQDLEFKFPALPKSIFKAIVNVLHGQYDMGKAYALLEGFSILECHGLTEELETKLAARIHAYRLENQNFIGCIHAFAWAEKRNLIKVKNSLREFIQRYIEANFDKEDVIAQIAHEIDDLNARTWIPLALNLKKFRFSSDFFDRLKLFSKSLVSLNLTDLNQNLTEEDLDQLKCLVQLRSLILSCRISCALNLSSLNKLHTLEIRKADICDDDLKVLSTPLLILKLKRCQRITGVGLQHISHKLISLTITGGKPPFFKSITPDGYETIGAFRKLAELNLKRTSIKGSDFRYLYSLDCLTHLDLTNSICLDDSAIEELKNFVSLIKLFLNKCSQIKGWGLKNLPKQLQTLSLADTHIDGESFGCLKTLHDLSTLNLSGCKGIRPSFYGHLGRLPKLTTLNLSRSSITDEGVKNLRILPRLTYLDLQDCKNVSDKTSKRIQVTILNNSQTATPRSQIMEAKARISGDYHPNVLVSEDRLNSDLDNANTQVDKDHTKKIAGEFFDLQLGVQPERDRRCKKIKRRFRAENQKLKDELEQGLEKMLKFQEESAQRQEELRLMVLSQKSENDNLRAENCDLKKAVGELQAGLQKASNVCKRVIFERAEERKVFEEVQAKGFELDRLKQELMEQNLLSQNENEKLKKQLEAADSANKIVLDQLKEFQANLLQMDEKLEQQQALLSEEKLKVTNLEQKLEMQKASFEEEKQNLHALIKNGETEHKIVVDGLNQKLVEQEKLLKEEKLRFDTTIKGREAEHDRMVQEIKEGFTKQENKYLSEISRLKGALEQQLELFEKQKDEVEAMLKELKESYEINKEKLEEEIKSLKKKNEQLEKNNKKHIKTIDILKIENEQLRTDKANLEKENEELKVTITELKDKLNELNATIKKLEKENEELTEAVANLENEIMELRVTIAGLQATINKLEEENKELNSKIVDLNLKIAGLEDDKKKLKEDKVNLEKNIGNLKSDKVKLEKTITNLQKDKSNLTNEKKALTAKIQSIENILFKKKDCSYVTKNIFTAGIIAHVVNAKNLKRVKKLIG